MQFNWIILINMNFTTIRAFYLLLMTAIISKSQAYFGLSSKMPISSSSLFSYKIFNQSISTSTSREVCELFSLPERQKRTCRQEKGVALTLMEAFKLSVYECQRQFEMERWNCPATDSMARINILKSAFKETAFLFAISSASLVHSLSRACSTGQMTQCTCDESLDDVENRKTWLWAGCGDNVKFGQKFAWKFLQQKKLNSNDLRAKLDKHNTEVGIKVVKDYVQKRCKCHGVSGTCTMKTCWKQMANFNEIGQILKLKYDRSVMADASNVASLTPSSKFKKTHKYSSHSKFRHKHFNNVKTPKHHVNKNQTKTEVVFKLDAPVLKSPLKLRKNNATTALAAKPSELVYLDKSPDFCQKSRYLPGTSGRVCDRGAGCHILCCGRGHNIQLKTISSSCQCKVIWCCNVECQVCQEEKEIYTCK
ncbi:Protein Wnt-9b [Chamberlinius hualienensis]